MERKHLRNLGTYTMKNKPNLQNTEVWNLDEDKNKPVVDMTPLLKFKEGKQLDIPVKEKTNPEKILERIVKPKKDFLSILNRVENTSQT